MSPALLPRLAVAVAAAGLIAAAVALVATRRPRLAVQVLLDFLLAGGLLRLTGHPGWPALATAAAIIALRRLVSAGLGAGVPARARGPSRR